MINSELAHAKVSIYHCFLDGVDNSNNNIAIIGGVVGGVILLLMITAAFCIVILRKSHKKEDHYSEVSCDTNYVSMDHNPSYVLITANPSYDVTTSSYSKTSEDECIYAQPDEFIQNSDLESTTIKKETNQGYGVSSKRDRAMVLTIYATSSNNDTTDDTTESPQSDIYYI